MTVADRVSIIGHSVGNDVKMGVGRILVLNHHVLRLIQAHPLQVIGGDLLNELRLPQESGFVLGVEADSRMPHAAAQLGVQLGLTHEVGHHAFQLVIAHALAQQDLSLAQLDLLHIVGTATFEAPADTRFGNHASLGLSSSSLNWCNTRWASKAIERIPSALAL